MHVRLGGNLASEGMQGGPVKYTDPTFDNVCTNPDVPDAVCMSELGQRWVDVHVAVSHVNG